MAETDGVDLQDMKPRQAGPASREEKVRAARRKFLRQALAASSAIAVSQLLPSSLLSAAAQAPPPTKCPANLPAALTRIGEISRNGNKLQAVIRVVNGNRNVPSSATAGQPLMLRFYKGYNPANTAQAWPTDNVTACGPGPTLRCEVGDDVQITFLNQVNVNDFPGTLATGDYGTANGCDQRSKTGKDATGKTTTNKNWYPANDEFPNCLHASSAANIHFHGTHVTPSTTGDNVLVNIWPNTNVSDRDVQETFRQIFHDCDTGHTPQKWEDLPLAWRLYQERLMQEYDATAPYEGPGKNPTGHGLPEFLRLWPQDALAIQQGVWPQYYVGSYPYCFKIPRYEGPHHGVRMGQAPGTHWYHSHKHGSTANNMFNGLSGALIIEDNHQTGYDGALNTYYGRNAQGRPNLEQVVMVFQQITDTPNLLSARGGSPPILVNGQFTPTLSMRPGQVQLWRMINATVSKFITAEWQPCVAGDAVPQFRQTAQDGVQYSRGNYTKLNKGATQPLASMAPANRVDLLVQAPNKVGVHVLQIPGVPGSGGNQPRPPVPILFINVSGDALPMDFIPADKFPEIPDFLDNIDPKTIRLRREVTYGWDFGTNAPGRKPNGDPPQYYIDGKKFEDQVINQVMLLDTAEEWTIYNKTIEIAHPFHIHVNPFQIVELYDPSNFYGLGTGVIGPDVLGPDFVWWDTFGIPPGVPGTNGKPDPNGKEVVPGYFKFRTRFVDFTGQYVQHCHILAHEDRGMMQLLEVVTNKTILKHH
ncbi:MAG TPA: multicopper oxidase domain-containing protein [Blastocatellia bacterium]|nr:multicopper oxidase domain-containing protein [Blastocatellia bacterium]